MRNAVAFANNDVVTIAWSYGAKPEGCMGFALYRIDAKEEETPLPSHAVFPGDTIEAGQTTAEFPIQKFYWKDVYARLVGDETGNYTFRYKVVPVEGTPDSLKPMSSLPILITNEVTVSGVCSPSLTAIFNRGMVPNINANPRGRKAAKPGRKPLFNADIFKERFDTIERVFGWEDKFRRLLLRFERCRQLHYAFKTLAYTP